VGQWTEHRVKVNREQAQRSCVRSTVHYSQEHVQDCLDQVTDILSDAYTPEASLDDLAAAVGDALDVIEGNAPDDGAPRTQQCQGQQCGFSVAGIWIGNTEKAVSASPRQWPWFRVGCILNLARNKILNNPLERIGMDR